MNWRLRKWLYLTCTFVEAVCVTLANRLRRLLGWKPPRHPTHVFLRQFLLHALGRETPLRLTCCDRTDGAGAQAHTMMAAMSFARARGHTYVHTTFKEIAHPEQPMGAWVDAWEELFGFGEIFESAGPGRGGLLNYSTFHPRLYHQVADFAAGFAGHAKALLTQSGYERRHFHPFLYYADAHPDAYLDVLPALKKRFRAHHLRRDADEFEVAVHLRRGDVTPSNPRRFTACSVVRETVSQVRDALVASGLDYRIRVYSVGRESEFETLCAPDVQLQLNQEAQWTLRQLVGADLLVMSKSSFSYVAGLLSDGLVLYQPFWHSPLSHWIPLDRKGRCDARRLSANLGRLAKERPGRV